MDVGRLVVYSIIGIDISILARYRKGNEMKEGNHWMREDGNCKLYGNYEENIKHVFVFLYVNKIQ